MNHYLKFQLSTAFTLTLLPARISMPLLRRRQPAPWLHLLHLHIRQLPSVSWVTLRIHHQPMLLFLVLALALFCRWNSQASQSFWRMPFQQASSVFQT